MLNSSVANASVKKEENITTNKRSTAKVIKKE